MANKNTRGQYARNSSKNKTKEKAQQKNKEAAQRIITVVVFALSVIFFFIAVLPGEGAWNAVHNFYLGLFGKLSACLFPILAIAVTLLYSCLKNSEKSFTASAIESVILIILISAFIHIISNQPGDDFAAAVTNAYETAPVEFNGGLFGAMLGWALLTFGKAPAVIVDVVLIFVDFMLLTGITVMEFLKGAAKPAVATYDRVDALVEERRQKRKSIDVPLDEKALGDAPAAKSAKPKKKAAKKQNDELEIIKENNENPEFRATDEIIAELNSRSAKAQKKTAESADDDIVKDNQEKNESEKAEKFEVSPEQMQSGTGEYNLPGVDLLKDARHASQKDVSNELKRNAEKLIDTLRSFNVEATVTDISRGPTVTRYELKPAAGIRISKITGLADDIALNLAARHVRIEAPIPGKSAVGIEIPNNVKNSVAIKEIIDTPEFFAQKSKLAAGLGKDIAGKAVYCDIAKMPHLLIAGTTGSGKSVCMNTIIVSILYRARPDEVKFVMIDPKQVEFSKYAGIPHLLVPVVTNPKKAAGALSWAVNEMLQRYNTFSESGVRDIDSYNKYVTKHDELEPMPKICIFIDELADLMMAAPKDVEDSICRLAQMARAAGMHLVIATQRPSVDVITGLVKANISSRIALTVSQQVDSRTILDMGGAEKLLGMGDMLYRPIDADKPYRVQGCFISDEEIEALCDFIKSQGETQYSEEIQKEIEEKTLQQEKGADSFEGNEAENSYDALFEKAAEMVIELGTASTSLLQRKLSVGYARGAKIIDQLEEFGVIGPQDGSKPRTVLMTQSMLLEKLAYNSGQKSSSAEAEAYQLKIDDDINGAPPFVQEM
ncbi:MAG: DNA translocase FtsK [Clostridiales bacterium]|nr:DNA translocase FtsK [Clostridiales bacterium]